MVQPVGNLWNATSSSTLGQAFRGGSYGRVRFPDRNALSVRQTQIFQIRYRALEVTHDSHVDPQDGREVAHCPPPCATDRKCETRDVWEVMSPAPAP